MSKNVKHLAALSLLAHANQDVHPAEIDFLKSVATRLSIDKKTADEVILYPEKYNHSLPVHDIDRYSFMGDILNLVAADGMIDDSEAAHCRKLCRKLGFEQDMVDGILDKIKTHLQNGFSQNKLNETIKKDLNRLTNKIMKNDKHS